MSVQDMLHEAQHLSHEERKALVKGLMDMLAESTQTVNKPKRSLREFRGVGASLYNGIDAQVYLNQIRDEWDGYP